MQEMQVDGIDEFALKNCNVFIVIVLKVFSFKELFSKVVVYVILLVIILWVIYLNNKKSRIKDFLGI